MQVIQESNQNFKWALDAETIMQLDGAGNLNVFGTITESGQLLASKYATNSMLSNFPTNNTLSNFALTSTANSNYAPSNTLSNFVLTTTANSNYAPSNAQSNWNFASNTSTWTSNNRLPLSGGTLTGPLTGTTINATTLQQGGIGVSTLFASSNHSAAAITSGTLVVARGGTGTVTSTGTGNNVLSANPTFTGTVVAATLNATTLQQGGVGVSTAFAPSNTLSNDFNICDLLKLG
jgi:hypothetical protein